MRKLAAGLTNIVALAWVAYQIFYVFDPFVGLSQHILIHITFAVVLVLLVRLAKTVSAYKAVSMLVLLAASLACLTYVQLQLHRLDLTFGMHLPAQDFVIGALILCIFVILSQMVWGPSISIIAVASILYYFFGHNIPGPLGFPFLGNDYVMMNLVMGTSHGVFGFMLPVSALLVFYFMVFGGVVGVVHVSDLFIDVGNWIGHLFRGGAAVTSLVGSSLMGMVTGDTMANAAFGGSYTIPAMKSQGFSGEAAAAIEAVASSGGQILPPIMGAAAFLMSSFTGVPYATIALKAIVPGLLFYVLATIGVALLIRHQGIRSNPVAVDKRLMLKRAPTFLIPLGALIFWLASGLSAGRAMTLAMFVCIGISLFQKCSRPSLRGLLDGLVKGAIGGAQMAMAIVALSIVAQVAISTDLGPKLAELILAAGGGIQWVCLILVMIACMFLGMGMTTVAVYTIVAIVMIPSMSSLGVPTMSAHFFVFFFAVLAALTPPVASAVLVTSRIAQASFWRSGIQSTILAIPILLIPFALVTAPQLLDFPFLGLSALVMAFALILSAWALGMVVYRHFLVPLNRVDFALAFIAAMALAVFVIAFQNGLVLTGAVLSLAALTVRQVRGMRGHTRQTAPNV